jgi:Tfp pilus assembly protein PilW
LRQKSVTQMTSSEQVVKDIRRATRKQYSAEEKIRIVLDGLRREIRIIGSNSCADKYSDAVDVIMDIKDRAFVLVGKSFSVWDFNAAIDSMAAGESIKTLLRFKNQVTS